jgi:hypothetical protein
MRISQVTQKVEIEAMFREAQDATLVELRVIAGGERVVWGEGESVFAFAVLAWFFFSFVRRHEYLPSRPGRLECECTDELLLTSP